MNAILLVAALMTAEGARVTPERLPASADGARELDVPERPLGLRDHVERQPAGGRGAEGQDPRAGRVRGLANEPNPVPVWFAVHGAELDPSRPFFYCQHDHPRGTCSSPYADDSCDDGTSMRVLSGYPNCIAFSGRSHISLLEERTIWQGAFTSVGGGMCRARTARGARIRRGRSRFLR